MQTYELANASSLIWYALLGFLAAIVSVAFTDSLLWLRALVQEAGIGSALGAAGDWRRGHGQLRGGGDLFFHLNGIAGDPYKTLTLALLARNTAV